MRTTYALIVEAHVVKGSQCSRSVVYLVISDLVQRVQAFYYKVHHSSPNIKRPQHFFSNVLLP